MWLCLPVIPLMEVYNKSLCKPRELLVEILQEYPEEVEHIFIPSCVVLTRCAGCCNDEMLQCMPTSSYNITMEVSSVNIFSSCTVLGVLCSFAGVTVTVGRLLLLFIQDMSVPWIDSLFLPTLYTLIRAKPSKCPSGWHKCSCCLLKSCSSVICSTMYLNFHPISSQSVLWIAEGLKIISNEG